MTRKEAIKANWKAMKQRPFSERTKYIAANHWDMILLLLAALILICSLLYGFFCKKESALTGLLVNFNAVESTEAVSNKFCEYADLDSGLRPLEIIDNLRFSGEMDADSIYTMQFLTTYLSAGDLDFVISDEASFCYFAYLYEGVFSDIRSFLSEDEFQKLSGRILYIDEAQLTEREPSNELSDYADPLCPEAMEMPIPVGIALDDNNTLFNSNASDNSAFLGIPANAENSEMLMIWIDYLLAG